MINIKASYYMFVVARIKRGLTNFFYKSFYGFQFFLPMRCRTIIFEVGEEFIIEWVKGKGLRHLFETKSSGTFSLKLKRSLEDMKKWKIYPSMTTTSFSCCRDLQAEYSRENMWGSIIIHQKIMSKVELKPQPSLSLVVSSIRKWDPLRRRVNWNKK